jgi:cystathionine beta-lyase family protein involved in aluminum resistance
LIGLVESKEKQLVDSAEASLAPVYKRIDEIALKNQAKVLNAFRKHRLTEEYFAERTGYGMDDAARDFIDEAFATIFGAEAAAVRMQLVSGTHALACALFGNLMPGDRMVTLTGAPYDTLEKVIGYKVESSGSLKSLGVLYQECDLIALLDDEKAMRKTLQESVAAPTRMAYIQKSCGYSFTRRTLTSQDIEKICKLVHDLNPDCIVLVDNCYGEFVEEVEPTEVGADLIAGSLIKNPGGGLAISGGYIAGRARFVEAALNRLTAPGIGGHLGLTFNQNRLLLQGLFTAPAVVSNAVKAACLTAEVFKRIKFDVKPESHEIRGDIIQAIRFGDAPRLVNFLKAIQSFSPVNAHVVPEPATMPGYEDKVVMAGGTFIEGSTIEFSADGPLRPPYVAFVQGGLTYQHVKCALVGTLELGSTPEYLFLKG